MKKIIFITLYLCTQAAFSNNTLFNKVKEKLATDQIAFSQFQYLGQIYCLDGYLRHDKNFRKSYLELNDSLSTITRLFTQDGLHNTFIDFEKDYPKVKRDNQRGLDFNNYINICQNEFSAKKLSKPYKKLINNLDNYHTPGEIYRYRENEDIEQNMKDYLEYGKMDYRRFL